MPGTKPRTPTARKTIPKISAKVRVLILLSPFVTVWTQHFSSAGYLGDAPPQRKSFHRRTVSEPHHPHPHFAVARPVDGAGGVELGEIVGGRSEERRVGKEGGARGSLCG